MPIKKVFDIIPPKEHKDPAPAIKVSKKPAVLIKPIQPQKPIIAARVPAKVSFKASKPINWWPILTILTILCLSGASYFLIKPKAEISLWPKKSPLSVQTQVAVNVSQKENAILGKLKTQECSSSQEFQATGVKSLGTKASGVIRVYNAFSTTAQVLIANTRFVSDGGKLFKIPQKIVIPGAHYEGNKLIPGEIEAVVEAGEAGEEYNIGPSSFSLPALSGTPRYTSFYAKSFGSMTGGSKQETAQITAADLSSAQESLTEIALDNCKKTLQAALSPEEYAVSDEAFKSEVIEFNPLVKAGQNVNKFTLTMKARATAMVFNKSDLESVAKTYMAGKVPESKQLDQNSVALSFAPQSIDLNKGIMILSVEVSAEIYSAVDENSIKEAVRSKTLSDAEASLKQFPEISDFQVRLWPFWANKAPFEPENITIKLRLD